MKRTVFKYALAFSALGAVACAPAFAAGPMGSNQGFSINANVVSSGATSTATDETSDSGQTTGVGLQARYDWSITPDFSLGVGAGFSGGNHQQPLLP
jgi:outer membrane immunogenic protein